MTNPSIPPCPVCGTVPEHHDRIFCGLVNKCNCLSANRDCTIDAWTRWCAEELRRACRELGVETVEQLKTRLAPDPRVAYLDKMGVNTLSDLIMMAFHASEYSERMNDPRVAVLEKKLAKLTDKLAMVEQESEQRLSAIIGYSDQLLAMKEKYEPVPQNEPHPDGCFSSDPNDVTDCESDGHYSCKDCKRNSRIAAQRGEE